MTLTSQQTSWAEPAHLPRQRGESSSPRVAAPRVCGPTALTRMHVERGVSPWLDQLSRDDLVDGSLSQLITAGVRGIGAGPTELGHGPGASAECYEQLSWLLGACAVLRPVHELSQGTDGFVSLQVDPVHPRRTRAALATICELTRRIDRPNLLVAIQATPAGVQALQAAVSAGCNINATSIFSLARYAAVIEAYQAGIEAFVARGGDPTTVHGFASFSLSRLDAEVDGRIGQLGDTGAGALQLRGQAAVAQAALACRLFEERFSTDRWTRLARRGATPQRLAWVCTGTRLDPDHAARYLDALSVPNTVQVLSASMVATLNEHGLGDRAPGIDVASALDGTTERARQQ